MSSNFSSFSSSSTFSSSNTGSNGQTQTSGSHQSQQSYTGPDGNTTVHSTSQKFGEPASHQTSQYDNQGRELTGGGQSAGRIAEGSGDDIKVEDVTDAEAQKDRDAKYEEAMEDEYAKREGGA